MNGLGFYLMGAIFNRMSREGFCDFGAMGFVGFVGLGPLTGGAVILSMIKVEIVIMQKN